MSRPATKATRPTSWDGALRPQRAVVRSDSGNWALERALDRRGFGPVAGVDEAGRGACAGPLVVASCVLRPGDSQRLAGLTDSKLLTERARERMYDLLMKWALDYAIVVIPPEEVDARGVHVANIEGMRRAVARLRNHPGYVLVDGFRVAGLTARSMPVVKGDRAVACVAAASVLAKVTRDRIMVDLHDRYPVYGFDVHKGYCTTEHSEALDRHGPTEHHRWSYVNVVSAAARHGLRAPRKVARSVSAAEMVQNGTLEFGTGVDIDVDTAADTLPASEGGARIR